jgi:hypothetical protein
MTEQPASASAIAQAHPKPLLEAQTIALRPAMPKSMANSVSRPAPTPAPPSPFSAKTGFVARAQRPLSTQFVASAPKLPFLSRL